MVCKDHWDNKTHTDNGVVKSHYKATDNNFSLQKLHNNLQVNFDNKQGMYICICMYMYVHA